MMTISNPPSRDRSGTLQIHPSILGKIEYTLFFLLFLSCSSPYRIWAGNFSVGLSEIGAWVFIFWRWMTGERAEEETERTARWLTRGLRVIVVWAGILWLVSADWAGRREMFYQWLLAALVFSAMLRSPVRDSKRLALLFILAALPNAFLGAVQHLSGIGLAPKDFSGWNAGAAFFPVYGFFGHSNDLAVFLYWPFLLAAGLAVCRRGWSRLPYALFAVLIGLALYWTISRSTLLTLGAAAVILALMYFLPRRKAFLAAMAAGLGTGVLLLAGIFLTQNLYRIDRILSGRLDLWSSALQVITSDPAWLPFGYLSIPPAGRSVFWLPHNIYLLSWMEFGWPGLVLLIGMAAFFLYDGMKRYAGLRRHPSAACLWAGLAGLFLVNGMASLYFHEPYVVVNFICVAVIWIFQTREIESAPTLPQADPPAAKDRTRSVKSARPSQP
jgi:O-antigen ligase